MSDGIEQREGEIWEMHRYYFYCPVCEKPYTIEYDASRRTAFDNKYDEHTCSIGKNSCQFCNTRLLIAYSAELQEVVAYDIEEEKHWKKQSAKFEKAHKKFSRIKKECKRNATDELKDKKKKLRKECAALEKSIVEHDNLYEEHCLAQVMARETQESVPFVLSVEKE